MTEERKKLVEFKGVDLVFNNFFGALYGLVFERVFGSVLDRLPSSPREVSAP